MEPVDPHLFPDGVLDGTYQILQVLGRGGMATVYEGRILETGAKVAIKVMLVKGADAPADIQPHFFNELLLATRVKHPRIVEVIDFGVSAGGEPYIVMERLYGQTIFHEIRQNGPMEPARSVARLLEVLDGLEAAHALNVVHADIKPTNLFLGNPRTLSETVTILDFGVARQLGRSRPGTGLGMGGTPRYAPPEWLRGAPVQVQGDLYQAGMVLAEMLSGETLLQATTVRQCLAIHASGPIKLPAALTGSAFREVVEIAMDPDPNERFRSVAELRDALTRALHKHQARLASFRAPLEEDDGGKTVRFDDYSDFSDAVLAEEKETRPRNALSEELLGAPVLGPRSSPSIRNAQRNAPSLPPRSHSSFGPPRGTPVPASPRHTPLPVPRSTPSLSPSRSRSTLSGASVPPSPLRDLKRSLPPLLDGSLQPPSIQPDDPAQAPGAAPQRSILKFLLLDALPPEERIAILGLLVLLCFSLTGGAFLGSMLISVIVFAR